MWLTIDEVSAITGVQDIDPAAFAQATAAVEIYANRTEAMIPAMRKTDVHWVKQAIAWQTIGIMNDPDWIAKKTFTTVAQDGVNIGSYSQASIMLHPLAERALKNLSWKTSALHPVKTPAWSRDFRNEGSDTYTTWGRLDTSPNGGGL